MATPQMGVKTWERDEGKRTVLGPCPGCDAWQLDYTDEVAQQWIVVGWDSETNQPMAIVDLWYQVVEQILWEHAQECPHLRDLIAYYD